jgi:hypothetical protein
MHLTKVIQKSRTLYSIFPKKTLDIDIANKLMQEKKRINEKRIEELNNMNSISDKLKKLETEMYEIQYKQDRQNIYIQELIEKISRNQ